MSQYILEFESPLKDIENKIQSLKATAYKTGIDVTDTVRKLEKELIQKQNEIKFALNNKCVNFKI